jgi:hypothetical protein
VDYPGIKPGYQVTRDGQIRSPGGRILRPNERANRSYVSVVMASGKNSSIPLDVLVLSAFSGYVKNHRPEHHDDDPRNCHIDNLTWSAEPRKRALHKQSRVVKRKRAGRSAVSMVVVKAYRMYEANGVLLGVQDSGEGLLSIAEVSVPLTPEQLSGLTHIAARVKEVNALMGVGK